MSKRRIAAAVVVVLVAALAGGYITSKKQTPVSPAEAVRRFREENDRTVSPTRRLGVAKPNGKGRDGAGSRKPPTRRDKNGSGAVEARVADETGRGAGRADARRPQRVLVVSAPAEGVYSYRGNGREQLGPWKRDFFPTSHRLITREDENTWLEHHIFSDEREFWSRISTDVHERKAHSQRHYIEVGPYAVEKELRFAPPLVSAMLPPATGHTWNGRFDATTNDGEDVRGTYSGRTFEERVWNVGGVDVRVWGVDVQVHLRGDISGEVRVKRWFSPGLGLNVREDYHTDVDLGAGLTYHADWSVTLQSVTPRG